MRKINKNGKKQKIIEIIDIDEKEKLNESDDYELYNLIFTKAINLDKRKFLKIYLSLLKREQLIWLTFIS